jgi:SAM-dependent methyltransferase
LLTVSFRRIGLQAGDRVLDLGCGGGRHAFEAHRRGAHTVAFDRNGGDTKDAAAMLAAMRLAGEAPDGTLGTAVNGDALSLPFADASFDRVIAAEVLEHVPEDGAAMAELARVLRPGGTLAVTVPRWFPEKVCWSLAEEYHAPHVPDGHVRIYRRSRLAWLVAAAGLRPTATHHAHALHSPYWWLKCALGLDRADRWPVRAYHRLLVWDIMRRPLLTRALDRALNPVLGKSLVLYAEKPLG